MQELYRRREELLKQQTESLQEQTWQSLHLKNATVSLVLLIPILLMLLALGASVQKERPEKAPILPPIKQEPGPDEPKTPANGPLHDQPPIIVLAEAQGYSFETGKADIAPEFGIALKTKIVPRRVGGFQKTCVELAHIEKDARILDLGVGAGHTIIHQSLRDLRIE
jgi:hypothetical protein